VEDLPHSPVGGGAYHSLDQGEFFDHSLVRVPASNYNVCALSRHHQVLYFFRLVVKVRVHRNDIFGILVNKSEPFFHCLSKAQSFLAVVDFYPGVFLCEHGQFFESRVCSFDDEYCLVVRVDLFERGCKSRGELVYDLGLVVDRYYRAYPQVSTAITRLDRYILVCGSSSLRGASGSNRVCAVRGLCGDEFVRVLFHVLVVFRGHEGLERSIHHLTKRWVNMDRVANRLVRSVPRIHQRYDLVYEY